MRKAPGASTGALECRSARRVVVLERERSTASCSKSIWRSQFPFSRHARGRSAGSDSDKRSSLPWLEETAATSSDIVDDEISGNGGSSKQQRLGRLIV